MNHVSDSSWEPIRSNRSGASGWVKFPTRSNVAMHSTTTAMKAWSCGPKSLRGLAMTCNFQGQSQGMCFAFLNNLKKYRFWIAPKWCKEFWDPNRYLSKQLSMNQAKNFPLKNPYAPSVATKWWGPVGFPNQAMTICSRTTWWYRINLSPPGSGVDPKNKRPFFGVSEIPWLDPWWFFGFYIKFSGVFFLERLRFF